jgi:peptide/nickel transport system permease protein
VRFLVSYVLPRLLQWVVVIVVGVTVAFIIPRLLPTNPVNQVLERVSATTVSDPAAVASLKSAITAMYGLQGSALEQYLHFWQHLLRGDLGPSLSAFPTPVTQMIWQALPWTIGLLGVSTVISWLLGLVLGTLSAYRPDSLWSRLVANGMVTIYPIPYFILALVLVLVFAYYVPLFPLVGGASGAPSLSLGYVWSIVWHSFLPALSLVLVLTAFRFLIARALASTMLSSDPVTFAETAGIPRRRIVTHYVMRNTMLPQITDLALSLGAMFEGALITEVAFSYPGIGYRLYTAILQSDYNLILGVTLFSIVGIATAALLIDLAYPLFDPRVRYR